eukprot:CAMPEP_0118917812 /NCGR_PEP_ID=MMETSP1166-20130328/17546_1 /TAXON_ID=1104430 /ORGANISM="Chrysoreinhardia sp, Strain CCMP3193" /LENGTH=326 /DNA_ID=CAMNT_0006858033 /DNA_START=74 /DNA_END=1054 /DNA_ORIENTATION=+
MVVGLGALGLALCYLLKKPKESSVSVSVGRGGLEVVKLKHKGGASAEIYTFGATVTSYKKNKTREVLWVSEGAVFDGEKAIRGGIPLVFPQFGPTADAALGVPSSTKQHGFARISQWQLETSDSSDSSDCCTAVLRLTDSEATRALFPFGFELSYTVTLDATSLRTELKITNVDDSNKPFAPQALLHTYYAADPETTAVQGLEAHTYVDQLTQNVAVQAGPVNFHGETDRIYDGGAITKPKTLSTPTLRIDVDATLVVDDDDTKKPFAPDVVVWNPHVKKAKSMSDFDDDGWRHMICLEPGVLAKSRPKINPGDAIILGQTITPID